MPNLRNFFSRRRQGIIIDPDLDSYMSYSIPRDHIFEGAISHVSFGSVLTPTQSGSDEYYHGCSECMRYSANFGQIITDEDFEQLKESFVTHFNEKHRDLIQKRTKVHGIYKEVPKYVANKENIETSRRYFFRKIYWGGSQKDIDEGVKRLTRKFFINPLIVGVKYPEYDVVQ